MLNIYLNSQTGYWRHLNERFEKLFRPGVWWQGTLTEVPAQPVPTVRVSRFAATSTKGEVAVSLDGLDDGSNPFDIPLDPNSTLLIALQLIVPEHSPPSYQWHQVKESCFEALSGSDEWIIFGRVTTDATAVTSIAVYPAHRLDPLNRYPTRPPVNALGDIDLTTLQVGETVFVLSEQNFYYSDGSQLLPVLTASTFYDLGMASALGSAREVLKRQGSGILAGGPTYSQKPTLVDYSHWLSFSMDANRAVVGSFTAAIAGNFLKANPTTIDTSALANGQYIAWLEYYSDTENIPAIGEPYLTRWLQRTLVDMDEVSLPDLDQLVSRFDQALEDNYEYAPLQVVGPHEFAKAQWRIRLVPVDSGVVTANTLALPAHTLRYLDLDPPEVWDTTETYTRAADNDSALNQFIAENVYIGRLDAAHNGVAYAMPLFVVDYDAALQVSTIDPFNANGARVVHPVYPRAGDSLAVMQLNGAIEQHNVNLEQVRGAWHSGFMTLGGARLAPTGPNTVGFVSESLDTMASSPYEPLAQDLFVHVDGFVFRVNAGDVPELTLSPPPASGTAREFVYLEMRRALYVNEGDLYVDTGIPVAYAEAFTPQTDYPAFPAAAAGGDPLAITSNPIADAAFPEVPYLYQLAATGGTPDYTWSVVEGSLPPGLLLTSTGLIAGVLPATTDASPVAHPFAVTVEVLDNAGTTVRQALTLTATVDAVNVPASPPANADTGSGVAIPHTNTPALTASLSGSDRVRAHANTLKYILTFRVERVQSGEFTFDTPSGFYTYDGSVPLDSTHAQITGPERRLFSTGAYFTRSNRDPGLWVGVEDPEAIGFPRAITEDPRLVLDERVYAIPVAIIQRRNTGIYNEVSNRAGSAISPDPLQKYVSLRPDGRLDASLLHEDEILDLRHLVHSDADGLRQATEHSLDLLARGELRTSFGYMRDGLGNEDRTYLAHRIPVSDLIPNSGAVVPTDARRILPYADGTRFLWSDCGEFSVRPFTINWTDFNTTSTVGGVLEGNINNSSFDLQFDSQGHAASFVAPLDCPANAPVRMTLHELSGRTYAIRQGNTDTTWGLDTYAPVHRGAVMISTDRVAAIPAPILAAYPSIVRRNVMVANLTSERLAYVCGAVTLQANGAFLQHLNDTARTVLDVEELSSGFFLGNVDAGTAGPDDIVDGRVHAYLGTTDPGHTGSDWTTLISTLGAENARTDFTMYAHEEHSGGLVDVPERLRLSKWTEHTGGVTEYVYPDITAVKLRRKITQSAAPLPTLEGYVDVPYADILEAISRRLWDNDPPAGVDLVTLFEDWEPSFIFPIAIDDGVVPVRILSFCNDTSSQSLRVYVRSTAQDVLALKHGTDEFLRLSEKTIPEAALPSDMVVQPRYDLLGPPYTLGQAAALPLFVHGYGAYEVDVYLRTSSGSTSFETTVGAPTVTFAVHGGLNTETFSWAVVIAGAPAPPINQYQPLYWNAVTNPLVTVGAVQTTASLFAPIKNIGANKPVPALNFDCYYNVSIAFRMCVLRKGIRVRKASKSVDALYEWRTEILYNDTPALPQTINLLGLIEPSNLPGQVFNAAPPSNANGTLEDSVYYYNTAVRADDGVIMAAYAYRIGDDCSSGGLTGTNMEYIQSHIESGFVGTNFVPFLLTFNDSGQVSVNGQPDNAAYQVFYLVRRYLDNESIQINYEMAPYQGITHSKDDARDKLAGRVLECSDVYSTTLGAGRPLLNPALCDLSAVQDMDVHLGAWAPTRYHDERANYANVIAHLPFPEVDSFGMRLLDPGGTTSAAPWGLREGLYGPHPVYAAGEYIEPTLVKRPRRSSIGDNDFFNIATLARESSSAVIALLSYARNQGSRARLPSLGIPAAWQDHLTAAGSVSRITADPNDTTGVLVSDTVLRQVMRTLADQAGNAVAIYITAQNQVIVEPATATYAQPAAPGRARAVGDLLDPNHVSNSPIRTLTLQTGTAIPGGEGATIDQQFSALATSLLASPLYSAAGPTHLLSAQHRANPTVDPLHRVHYLQLTEEQWEAFKENHVATLKRGYGVYDSFSSLGLASTCWVHYPSANVFFGPSAEQYARLAPDGHEGFRMGTAWAGPNANMPVASKTGPVYSYLGMLLANGDGNLYLQVTAGHGPSADHAPVGGIYDAFIPAGRPLVRTHLVDAQLAAQPPVLPNSTALSDWATLASSCSSCVELIEAPPVVPGIECVTEAPPVASPPTIAESFMCQDYHTGDVSPEEYSFGIGWHLRSFVCDFEETGSEWRFSGVGSAELLDSTIIPIEFDCSYDATGSGDVLSSQVIAAVPGEPIPRAVQQLPYIDLARAIVPAVNQVLATAFCDLYSDSTSPALGELHLGFYRRDDMEDGKAVCCVLGWDAMNGAFGGGFAIHEEVQPGVSASGIGFVHKRPAGAASARRMDSVALTINTAGEYNMSFSTVLPTSGSGAVSNGNVPNSNGVIQFTGGGIDADSSGPLGGVATLRFVIFDWTAQ